MVLFTIYPCKNTSKIFMFHDAVNPQIIKIKTHLFLKDSTFLMFSGLCINFFFINLNHFYCRTSWDMRSGIKNGKYFLCNFNVESNQD